MSAASTLQELLLPDRPLRALAPGLYTSLPPELTEGRAGRERLRRERAREAPWFLRAVWGISGDSLTEFTREALASGKDELFLDIGGGELSYSADAYVAAQRPVVVLDRSLPALERARARIVASAGRWPKHIALLHADALSSPLRPDVAQTVLALGITQRFATEGPRLDSLFRHVTPGGEVFLTSAVQVAGWRNVLMRVLRRGGVLEPVPTADGLIDAVAERASRPDLRLQGCVARLRSKAGPQGTLPLPV